MQIIISLAPPSNPSKVQERIKWRGCRRGAGVRELIPHVGFIPKVIALKLFLDHSWFRKSQDGLEIDNL